MKIVFIFLLLLTMVLAGCTQQDPGWNISVPYLYQIAEGNVPEHEPFMKLGYNSDVGVTEEDIWTEGGIYVFPAAAQQMEIVSTSVEDDPVKADLSAGTGIWSVRIYYLDNLYVEHTEDITLNGLAEVTTVATNIFRVNAIRALTAGTGLKAAGDINLRNLANTPIYRDIEVGYTRGRALVYTVPNGKTLFVTSMSVSSGYSTAGKNVKWTARANWDDITMTTSTLFAPFFEIQTQDAAFHVEFEIPYKFPEHTDIKLSAVGDSANSVCTAAMRGWMEDD